MTNPSPDPRPKFRLLAFVQKWSRRLGVRTRLRRRALVGGGLLGAVGLGVLAPRWHNHASADPVPAATVVAVAKVARADLTQTTDFDAEFRPFQEADLHAKVAGFLKEMRVDIGDQVKEGELLATLEVPELRDDILRAEAVLRRSRDSVKRAEADHEEAHLSYSRLADTAKANPKLNLVAPQDLDAARAKDLSAEAALGEARSAVEVAQADLTKLETLKSYTRIVAPFAGVITKRFADPGALIPGGTTSSQVTPLLRLSDNSRLRLTIPVSVSYVSGIGIGQVVQVRVPALGQSFKAKVSRFSRKVDTATRTMDVEVDVDNPELTLVPGMYATVALQLARRDHTLAVPVVAVSRKGTPSVYVVQRDNQLEERRVKLGLETPTLLEVLDGLRENELVFVGSRALVHPGQKVDPKIIAATSAL